MAKGRLFLDNTGTNVIDINYRLIDASANAWWGELTLEDFRRIEDGGGYTIEFGDGSRGSCILNKKINKAVSGLLPLYCYRFRGIGPVVR